MKIYSELLLHQQCELLTSIYSFERNIWYHFCLPINFFLPTEFICYNWRHSFSQIIWTCAHVTLHCMKFMNLQSFFFFFLYTFYPRLFYKSQWNSCCSLQNYSPSIYILNLRLLLLFEQKQNNKVKTLVILRRCKITGATEY